MTKQRTVANGHVCHLGGRSRQLWRVAEVISKLALNGRLNSLFKNEEGFGRKGTVPRQRRCKTTWNVWAAARLTWGLEKRLYRKARRQRDPAGGEARRGPAGSSSPSPSASAEKLHPPLSLSLSLSLSDPGFSPSTLYCGSPGLGSSASCFGDSLALCSLLYTQKGFLNPFPWEKSSFCST